MKTLDDVNAALDEHRRQCAADADELRRLRLSAENLRALVAERDAQLAESRRAFDTLCASLRAPLSPPALEPVGEPIPEPKTAHAVTVRRPRMKPVNLEPEDMVEESPGVYGPSYPLPDHWHRPELLHVPIRGTTGVRWKGYGVWHTLAEWADIVGCSTNTLYKRIYRDHPSMMPAGVTIETSLSEPFISNRRRPR